MVDGASIHEMLPEPTFAEAAFLTLDTGNNIRALHVCAIVRARITERRYWEIFPGATPEQQTIIKEVITQNNKSVEDQVNQFACHDRERDQLYVDAHHRFAELHDDPVHYLAGLWAR